MLEARFIGKFDIRFNGEQIVVSTRAAQSLFAYLLLTARTRHRREKLAGIFWPDTKEEKARAYLRHELWRIRKALSKYSPTEYLIADDICLSFNASVDYWLDVDLLKRLDDLSSIEEHVDALSSYQGELLPGFYEDWVTEERERLQVIFERRVGKLLALFENQKRWDEMVEWAERWIALAEMPEEAYRHLMAAYAALGDRARLAATYERYVKTLQDLDLEPSEEVRARIFRRSPNVNLPIPLTSFIGREKEIKEISGLLSNSRLVTLTGSGGVGKTRLAIQVVAEVMERFPMASGSLISPPFVTRRT